MTIFLAIIALLIFSIVGVIYIPFLLIFKTKKVKWYKFITKEAFSFAFTIDVFGNYAFRHLWNAIFITRFSYRFGEFGETLSSVFGKNIAHGALNPLGYLVAWTIDLVDISKWKSGFKGDGFHCVANIQTYDEIKNFIKTTDD